MSAMRVQLHDVRNDGIQAKQN